MAAAVGQRFQDGLAIHRLGLGHADGYPHIVSGLAEQPLKSQAAVMNGIEHCPLGGSGVIQSVHIHLPISVTLRTKAITLTSTCEVEPILADIKH